MDSASASFDTVIVGAGIAGASLAWQLAQGGGAPRVLLLEREAQPGVHSTGRSAAMWMPSYGPPAVRALTRAAGVFYAAPPAGFADVPLPPPRGVLYVAAPGQLAELDALESELTPICAGLQRLDVAGTLARAPWLRAEQLIGSLWDPESTDIDVHAAQRSGDGWQISLADGSTLHAATLVNAAGAWGDMLAARCGAAPVGLQPRRRSAFTFAAPPGVSRADLAGWPLVASVDAEGAGWYVKPDAGQLLGSPANADDSVPHAVRPEELDIALAIDRIQTFTTLPISRPSATWAGLRSFVVDGELVVGFDDAVPGFFWLVGQGDPECSRCRRAGRGADQPPAGARHAAGGAAGRRHGRGRAGGAAVVPLRPSGPCRLRESPGRRSWPQSARGGPVCPPQRSQGGVEVPTGGDVQQRLRSTAASARERPAGPPAGVSRPGVNPGPTVTVRMKESAWCRPPEPGRRRGCGLAHPCRQTGQDGRPRAP